MTSYKVVAVNLGYASYRIEIEILEPLGAELVLAARDCTTEDEVIAAAADADAIFVREAPVSRRVLESLPRCRIVARYGVGVDNIDLEYARQKRIYVANVPGYGTEEVSDHAVALLLACIRHLPLRDRILRSGRFETDINDRIYRTTDKVLGIVGYGRIGRAVHRKWRGFLPARVLVYDPRVPAEAIRAEGGEPVETDVIFRESDYISLHAPLTDATRQLIDAEALSRMKPTAILVNTARGELIDEAALVEALRKGRILAAGLDVFDEEPVASDNPLLRMPNVVLSGHVGWYSKDAVRELQSRAAWEIARVLRGESPQCWVNPW